MSTPSIHPNSSTTPLLGAPNCMAHLPKEKGLSQKVTYSLLSDQPHCASHNNLLFMVIILVGWHCLLHLGELFDHDSISLLDFCKSINCLSVKFVDLPCPHVSFFLPMHKANHFFKGSTVIFEKHSSLLDPIHFFKIYLASHNSCFPHLPQLWLHSNSSIPMHSWFINRIHTVFPSKNVTRHLLHSVGTMVLVLAGTPLNQIQNIGHWSLDAFLIYLHKNPLLIQHQEIMSGPP